LNAIALARLVPWLAAAAGCALALWLFAPGFLSWDSAYQWSQARSGTFDALHPPLQTLLWSLIEPYWSGPTSMLLLQQLMLWIALAGIAASLPVHWTLRVLLVLLVGLWPPLFLLSAHIWKDIPMLGAFLLSVWLLRLELARPGWKLRTAALLMLLLACACRHNAITGVVPLLLWLVWRSLPALRDPGRAFALRFGAALALTLPLALLLQAAAQLPNYLPGVKRTPAVWSVVALWDMAAVSIAEDRLVLPADFILPDTRVEDLRPHFTDWSNTTVFNSGKLIPTLAADFSETQINALRSAWLRLPLEHPQAYFAHRARLASLLFGFDTAALPDHQVLMAGFVQMQGNPEITQTPNDLRDRVLGWAARNTDGPFFMGWIYLALAFAVMTLAALRMRSHDPGAAIAAAVAASALAYALPLALVSGSAEFRYLAWPIAAALLAPALLAKPGNSKPSVTAPPAG